MAGVIKHTFIMQYIYKDNLQSDRLITRMLTEGDIQIWADFFIDKDAVKFFPANGFETNLERAKHMISKQFERYSDNRFGLQVLIEKKSNEFIGLCGLLTQFVDEIIEIEVGYHIFKKYWGQGYATEAAKLFIDFAFHNNLTSSIISVIDIENFNSQRVAEKNGLFKEKQTKWIDGEDVYIYRIYKDNWI